MCHFGPDWAILIKNSPLGHCHRETSRLMPDRSTNGAIPFTHVGIMLPFVSYLDGVGVPFEKYLRIARIPPDLLERPEARVPLRMAYRFLDEAVKAEDIEAVGLHAGRATSPSDLGEFGEMLMRSRNVLTYLETGVRFIGAITSGERYWLQREGEWIRLSHRQDRPGIPESDKRHGYLFSLAMTINTLRRIAGPGWCPPEVRLPDLSHRESTALSEWLPDSRVITGSRAASFLFPASFLALPMPPAVNRNAPTGTSWSTVPVPDEFLASMQLLVESLIRNGHPALETAAEAAGLSVRSLRRRLAECGKSYSEVVTRTRITLAERWLAGTERPITEIALALGYTDRSNFTRAFRRENGMSPREYRKYSIGR